MKDMKVFLKEHKKTALIILFLLIVFVGCSAVSAINVASHRTQENEAAQMQSKSPAEDANGKEDETTAIELTASQKEAIAAYDEKTLDFIDSLGASIWSANGGKYTLRFLDDQYIETVNGKITYHSFAIDRIDFSSDTAGTEITTAVFDTDTGIHIVTCTNEKIREGEKAGASASYLSSASMFQLKDMGYERTESVENITVKGLNSEVTTLLGDDADKLTSELSKWCALHYPTATEAQWDGVASIDWTSNTITTSFTLNDSTSSDLTLVYKTEDGAFTFGL